MDTYPTTIDELLDEIELFAVSTLRVENERLCGMAMTEEKEGGYAVTLSFTSYYYERSGEKQWNHVPHITITAPDGSIVAEPSAADSSIRSKAFSNGVETAQYAFENLTEFVLIE